MLGELIVSPISVKSFKDQTLNGTTKSNSFWLKWFGQLGWFGWSGWLGWFGRVRWVNCVSWVGFLRVVGVLVAYCPNFRSVEALEQKNPTAFGLGGLVSCDGFGGLGFYSV